MQTEKTTHAFNKAEYIENLKKEFGEFDDNFCIEEDEEGNIIKLKIAFKCVKSIENICLCPTIKILELNNNEIKSIVPLYNLTSIVELNVSNNYLTNLFGVASNTSIQSLNADDNQISETWSMLVDKALYEKEFVNKGANQIREYFEKNTIALRGQNQIQEFLKANSK